MNFCRSEGDRRSAYRYRWYALAYHAVHRALIRTDSNPKSESMERPHRSRSLRLEGLVALLLVCIASSASSQANKRKAHSYLPPKGFVADSITAIRVAEAVLIPIWGAEDMAGQKPLAAKLRKGVWFVTGTPPEGTVGGVVELEIAKRDGRILRTWFSK
jgi:hypothetical protein